MELINSHHDEFNLEEVTNQHNVSKLTAVTVGSVMHSFNFRLQTRKGTSRNIEEHPPIFRSLHRFAANFLVATIFVADSINFHSNVLLI